MTYRHPFQTDKSNPGETDHKSCRPVMSVMKKLSCLRLTTWHGITWNINVLTVC